jgi:outer membrane immunogenic protein
MRNFSIVLGATAGLGLLAGQSFAADLPARYPAAVPASYAPVTNWTGLYVAGGGGYGLYSADSTLTAPFGVNGTTGGKGYFGTVQIGYDFQFAPNWVAGVFGDYDFSDIKGDIGVVGGAQTIELKQTSAWGVGGRIGYLITPQIYSYFTAGYTQARFEGAAGVCIAACVVLTLPDHDFSGYFLGGGTEVMLGGWGPGWSIKTEYRLANYDTDTVAFTTGLAGTTIAIEPTVQTIRSQLSYKFNWGR